MMKSRLRVRDVCGVSTIRTRLDSSKPRWSISRGFFRSRGVKLAGLGEGLEEVVSTKLKQISIEKESLN